MSSTTKRNNSKSKQNNHTKETPAETIMRLMGDGTARTTQELCNALHTSQTILWLVLAALVEQGKNLIFFVNDKGLPSVRFEVTHGGNNAKEGN